MSPAGSPAPCLRPPRPFPAAEYTGRIRRLQTLLRRDKLDGALFVDPLARLYYSGFESTHGLLAVDARDGASFFTDSRYIAAARAQLPFLPCAVFQRGDKLDAQLRRIVRSWKAVGLEGEMPANALRRLLGRIGRGPDDWKDASAIAKRQRAVKSPREQRALRAACAANDRMMRAVQLAVRPGMTEWEIRNLVRRFADTFGQGESFDAIVCAGATAAEPHHHPGLATLAENQSLLLDIGLKLDHYCADLTRTCFFGRPRKLFREVHAAVLAANRLAAASLRPGMTGAELDAIARDSLERAGYGKYFTHSLGHGVGLEVHEAPTAAPRATGKLEPGMVVTIEPGVYIPGRIGVRIEDVALVTRDGCEILSTAPRSWDLSLDE
ncbi:MAG: M24 family metallopeptidase [Kiritimatiellia bacterium]|jgi:Xaa-Pro aminopeptidase